MKNNPYGLNTSIYVYIYIYIYMCWNDGGGTRFVFDVFAIFADVKAYSPFWRADEKTCLPAITLPLSHSRPS